MTENRFALALQAAGAGLSGRGPEFQQQLAGRRQAERESQNKQLLARQRAFAEDNRGLTMFLERGDLTSARELIVNRQNDLKNFPDADTSDTDGALADVDSGNIEDLLRRSRALDQKAVIANVLPARGGDRTAAGRDFDRMSEGLSDDDELRARRIGLGLDPRATGSASQTIASTGQTEAVASSEAIIASRKAGGTEEAKLKKQLKFKPEITRAVKLAEKEAAARGETLTALARSEAALPGLTDAVGQLKALAPLVTSTIGGRAFDAVVKESGFGSTKGANARAKFVAIINNQVLPLLKETFGAAFTAAEGDALRATMGDVDASPDQKIEQLNAFIDQKTRNIEAKRLELDGGAQSSPPTQAKRLRFNPETGVIE